MPEAFLLSTITMATPILLAALGELIVEESGVINIGIEGAMLAGAFCGLTAAWLSRSLMVGLIVAIAAAMALNALLAVLVVSLAANQVVSGTAIDILALGLTGVGYRRIFGITGQAVTIVPLSPIGWGPLAHLPVIGPLLFNHDVIVYLTFALVPIIEYVLRHTPGGLHLRAVGENPAAADALGLGVTRHRWIALLTAGALSGLAGGYLTLAYTNTFVEGITGGRGFVALAVVIVGGWSAWGIAAVSLVFGAATALQFILQATSAALPYQLLLTLPYVLTLVLLTIGGGQAESPGALGEPYVRQ
jgi:ABC-type uncharacterized transport system permease subunit